MSRRAEKLPCQTDYGRKYHNPLIDLLYHDRLILFDHRSPYRNGTMVLSIMKNVSPK
jgi:hypothetical protein